MITLKQLEETMDELNREDMEDWGKRNGWVKESLTLEKIQMALDVQKVVMMENNGRPDCKNCSLAEVIQEILDKQLNKEVTSGNN